MDEFGALWMEDISETNVRLYIVHTYRGDLTVILVDPNGSQSTLRSPSGGGTNNLNESINIDKGTTTANGVWGLKVIDGAGADVGNIDFWSIEFL